MCSSWTPSTWRASGAAATWPAARWAAVAVDPPRGIGTVLSAAAGRGVRISRVVETRLHIFADVLLAVAALMLVDVIV